MKTEKLTWALGILVTFAIAWFSWQFFIHSNTPASYRESNAFLEGLETMNLRYNDFKYKAKDYRGTDVPVVLIALDDDSIREVGRWPWSRELIAQMTKNLVDLGVSAVGFDVIFSEPERGFPEADEQFVKVVTDHSDKIVLGAFSENMLNIPPYQDYCVTEGFLKTGGEQVVKINPTFVVDDESGPYDELMWKKLFDPLFANQNSRTELQVLKGFNKAAPTDLTQFQQNYLASMKDKEIFEYCQRWLTDHDYFFDKDTKSITAPLYQEVFNNPAVAAGDMDQTLLKFKNSIPAHPVPQYGQWTPNILPLQTAATYTASFNAQIDVDGYFRRYPLFYRSGNRLGSSFIPSLALQTYLVAKGYRADVTIAPEGKRKVKKINSFKIIDPSQEPEKVVMNMPIDSQGQLLIHFYGKQNALPYVSAKELFNDSPTITVRQVTPDVQSGKVDTAEMIVKKAEFFKGRSALVGATAMALYDLRNTPLQSNYPGPELHLTVLGNLLDQNFIQPVKKENLIVFCLILLLGLVSTYIWTHGTALSSFLVFIGTLAVIIGTEYYLFLEKNLLISGLFVVLLLVINYVGITIFRYFSEEAKKKQIKQTFSKYVAPAVVEELLKSEDNLKLGGRKEHMSVFFSDVRGFTTIAEKLTPQELSDVLNKYLSPMTELVFKNKGTLDKYMGDAIMAFFGAPVSTKHHATQACRCALDSIKKLAEIHAEFEKAGLPYIDIGIGINTGDMSVGNMGSNIVQNYTVMGDSVNLASRLEGINKQYGTRIIISEFTRKEIGENFLCREVDRVQVKGKLEPVRIFELLAEGKPDDKTAEWLASYLKSYDLYSEKKFPEAMTQFKTTMSIRESLGVKDPVSELYVERCEDYIATPPPADWDGVYVSKTK